MQKNAIGLWAKEIAGALVGALIVVNTGLQGPEGAGTLSNEEIIAAVAAFLGGILLTSFVKMANTGFWLYGKAVIQGLIATVGTLTVAVSDDGGWILSTNEIVMVVLAFLGGAGITSLASNSRASDPDQFKDVRRRADDIV